MPWNRRRQIKRSSRASGYAKRNRCMGHLYQGRYQTFLVEDAGSNCVNGSSAKPSNA